MTRWLVQLFLLSAAAAPVAAQGRYVPASAERLDTVFAFDRRGAVALTVGSGEIVVTGWDRQEVRLRARSERGSIRADATPSRLSVDVPRGRGGETRIEVTVPVGVQVTARSASGDIKVAGTKGIVEVASQSGDIEVEDAAGRVELRSFSGDISARRLSGTVEVNSLSGDIQLTDVRGDVDAAGLSGDVDLRNVAARYVRAKSTSGDISFEGALESAGRYELGSHSGSVDLLLPRGTGALLTVSTYSGGIESDFPITLKPGEHGVGRSRRYTFEIGNGEARISAESFSGDVTIREKGRPRPEP